MTSPSLSEQDRRGLKVQCWMSSRRSLSRLERVLYPTKLKSKGGLGWKGHGIVFSSIFEGKLHSLKAIHWKSTPSSDYLLARWPYIQRTLYGRYRSNKKATKLKSQVPKMYCGGKVVDYLTAKICLLINCWRLRIVASHCLGKGESTTCFCGALAKLCSS